MRWISSAINSLRDDAPVTNPSSSAASKIGVPSRLCGCEGTNFFKAAARSKPVYSAKVVKTAECDDKLPDSTRMDPQRLLKDIPLHYEQAKGHLNTDYQLTGEVVEVVVLRVPRKVGIEDGSKEHKGSISGVADRHIGGRNILEQVDESASH
jgi:hypothetical protein